MDRGDSSSSLGRQMRSVVGSEGGRRELALRRIRGRLLDRPALRTHLGRFVLLEHLGAGGFGSVYAAHDPLLDRKVALKILRTDPRDDALLREARALARLAHPNVVIVHEVLELDDRIVLVMELVDGAPLDRWVRDTRPTVADVVTVFAAVGRGLAAAHAQGLVHRDVKPANILIGADGRARIADFGLARRAPEIADTLSDADQPTARTSAAGTPKYWAPEVRTTGVSTRASDQYAFCLTLREMLDLIGGTLPRRVAKAIARGLERDPDARWPSMSALVSVLARRPLQPSRVLAVSGAVAVAAGTPWIAEAVERHDAAQQCRTEAAVMESEWTPASAARIHAAFARTGLHYADETWTRVESQLDAYPQAWRTAYEQACRAARVEAQRSEAAFARSRSCFEERRWAFASLLEVLGDAEAEHVRHAVGAAFDLPSVSQCDDERWLQQHPWPDDAQLAAQVLDLRVELQRAAWTRITRDPDAALRSTLDLRTRAEALGWDPVRAEVELELGHVHLEGGDLEQARAALEAAYHRAGAAGVDPVAADAAIGLVTIAGDELAQPAQAFVWAASAQMLLDRLDDHGRRRGRLAAALAKAHRRAGDLERARSHAEESLAAYERAPDATEIAIAEATSSVAVMHVDAGDFDGAAELMQQALAIKSRVLGPSHPSITDTLLNLAALDLARGAHEDALRHSERALAGALRLGERHPMVLGILANMAVVHLRLGDHERALAVARDVVDGRTEVLGAAHPDTITALNNLGAVYVESGRFADAEALFVDLLDRQRTLETPAPLEVARTLHNIAAVTVKLGEPGRARDRFAEALALLERELDAEHPEVLRTREGLAVAAMDAGDLDTATEILVPLLEIKRRVLSPASPEVAQTLRNLGLVALHRREYGRAKGLFAEAAAIHRAAGVESQDAAALLHDLGEAHRGLEQHGEAIASYERALELRTRILGENHPDTAATRDALQRVRKIAGP